MTLPRTIRAVVDPQAITRVTRLFNGMLADVLNELFQNARRAGASRVELETIREGDGPILVVRDDGHGIDDPAALLALGRSGWDADTARAEDPAGMGVFSLAGRDVEVRSRPCGAPAGWRAVIPAAAWESGTPIAIAPFATPTGTELRIALPDAWNRSVAADVQAAALHYPLPVFLDGSPCDRRDFLQGTVAIEEACGCRIGVFRDDADRKHRLNFHGLQVACRLPLVGEVGHPLRWSVRIDIIDAPDLKLVLPARKEVVENEAVTRLRVAAERAIFRAIAPARPHRLPFTAWRRARDLGVDLPPAEARLAAWAPATADGSNGGPFPAMIADGPMLIVPPMEPDVAQAAAPALRRPAFIAARAVAAEDAFAGYPWYDALPRIDYVAILIHADGCVHRHDDGDACPADMRSGVVDDLQLAFTLHPATCGAEPQEYQLPVDALVCDGGYDVEDALVLVRRDVDIDPDRLAAQIQAAIFCADDDPDSDSWETQHDRFRRAARARAIGLLHGEDAAELDRIRSAFSDDVRWLIPTGRTVTIVASSDGLTVEWTERIIG